MHILRRIRSYLAERRERRRRFAETLEFLSLPVEIQNDIRRPERHSRRLAGSRLGRPCPGI